MHLRGPFRLSHTPIHRLDSMVLLPWAEVMVSQLLSFVQMSPCAANPWSCTCRSKSVKSRACIQGGTAQKQMGSNKTVRRPIVSLDEAAKHPGKSGEPR